MKARDNFRLQIREAHDDDWVYYHGYTASFDDEIPVEEGIYKLHIAINPLYYEGVYETVTELLQKAIVAGVIAGFKRKKEVSYDNISSELLGFDETIQRLQDILDSKPDPEKITPYVQQTFKEITGEEFDSIEYDKSKIAAVLDILHKRKAANLRLINNPFTIYLPEEDYDNRFSKNNHVMNYKSIVEICFFIVDFFKKNSKIYPELYSNVQNEFLSKADLFLMPHISLRQEKINDKYIAIDDATEEQLEQLMREAQNSRCYKLLDMRCIFQQIQLTINSIKGSANEKINGILYLISSKLNEIINKKSLVIYPDDLSVLQSLADLVDHIKNNQFNSNYKALFSTLEKKQSNFLTEEIRRELKQLKKITIEPKITKIMHGIFSKKKSSPASKSPDKKASHHKSLI